MAANVTSPIMACPSMYKCSKLDQGTLFLPLFNESDWSLGLRIVLYFITMLWFFMGVAIGADLFMCAIEVREVFLLNTMIRVFSNLNHLSTARQRDILSHCLRWKKVDGRPFFDLTKRYGQENI